MTATEIIVVDRNRKALERAQWGADHVVVARDDRSHVQEVRDLTDGGGANVVIDYVGEGGAERDAVEMLAHNGVDFMVGYGGTLRVKFFEEGLFPETSFVSALADVPNFADETRLPTAFTEEVRIVG